MTRRANLQMALVPLLVLCGGFLFSQSGTVSDNPLTTPPAPEIQTQQAQPQPTVVQTEKQKAFTQDTQELLKLATELNDAVNKSTQNTLSVGVIRKAEEIEKLAKKMKSN